LYNGLIAPAAKSGLATAAATVFSWSSLIDGECPPVGLVAVQSSDSRLCLLVAVHLDEAEAFRAASAFITLGFIWVGAFRSVKADDPLRLVGDSRSQFFQEDVGRRSEEVAIDQPALALLVTAIDADVGRGLIHGPLPTQTFIARPVAGGQRPLT